MHMHALGQVMSLHPLSTEASNMVVMRRQVHTSALPSITCARYTGAPVSLVSVGGLQGGGLQLHGGDSML